MVTPYTNRLFNEVARCGEIELTVMSCTAREKNRSWDTVYLSDYEHVVLKGVELSLAAERIIHFNFSAWSRLSAIKPAVVAINGLYPTMLICALWAISRRVPLVFLTDGWSLVFPNSIFHRIVRPFVLKRCCSVICASEKGKRFFVEAGIDPHCIFVAHIIPAWPSPKNIPGFNGRPYHLLWCGQLDDRKNVPFFNAAVLSLKSRVSDLRVRIVGDGPLRDEMIRKLVQAGVEFEHTAYLPPSELAPVFSSSLVFVLPTKRDAWGLACNEAMQCGTPCVVSRNAGVADELVQHGLSGFVLDLDVAEWVDAATRLLQDKALWSAMSRAAILSAERFSLPNSAHAYVEGLLYAAGRNLEQF
jgi:glycosyltransferase involved in cell wall biosynthesis